jgi:hypothetical protein
MRIMIIPTMIGARTFTKKTSIAIMTIAAIIVTIIEPVLLVIVICTLQNINRCYTKYAIGIYVNIFSVNL